MQPLRNAYTTLAAIALPAVVLLGWTPVRGSGEEDFEEITVQRINVVEPDGSLKLVISNSALQHPGVIAGDTIMPDRVRPAGVTFFDDRGDEAGGLGVTGNDAQRWGGLMFDQIDTDETLRFSTQQGLRDGEFVHMAGMSIRDHNPAVTLPELLEYVAEVEAIEDRRGPHRVHRRGRHGHEDDRRLLTPGPLSVPPSTATAPRPAPGVGNPSRGTRACHRGELRAGL